MDAICDRQSRTPDEPIHSTEMNTRPDSWYNETEA